MHEVRATKPRGTSAEAQAQKKIALCDPIFPPINLHNLTFSLAWRVALRKKGQDDRLRSKLCLLIWTEKVALSYTFS